MNTTDTFSSSSSSDASNGASNILSLNDDCLLHVFQYLDLPSLSAVADVCSRFRENAQSQFSYSKWKNSYSIVYCSCVGELEIQYRLGRIASLLRNFGHLIEAIDLEVQHYHCRTPRKYHKTFAQLLRRYCSETLDKLTLQWSPSMMKSPKYWNRFFTAYKNWI